MASQQRSDTLEAFRLWSLLNRAETHTAQHPASRTSNGHNLSRALSDRPSYLKRSGNISWRFDRRCNKSAYIWFKVWLFLCNLTSHVRSNMAQLAQYYHTGDPHRRSTLISHFVNSINCHCHLWWSGTNQGAFHRHKSSFWVQHSK